MTLFGIVPLHSDVVHVLLVLAVFVAVFVFIRRIVHSPFGQVLKAIRDNEPRAISLGYDDQPLQAAGLRAVGSPGRVWPAR